MVLAEFFFKLFMAHDFIEHLFFMVFIFHPFVKGNCLIAWQKRKIHTKKSWKQFGMPTGCVKIILVWPQISKRSCFQWSFNKRHLVVNKHKRNVGEMLMYFVEIEKKANELQVPNVERTKIAIKKLWKSTVTLFKSCFRISTK